MPDESPPSPPPRPADPIAQVYAWLLSGAARHEVIESIEATYPEANAKDLIATATARILEAGNTDPAAVRGWCIAATRNVYQKALDGNDHAAALRAIKQLQADAGTEPEPADEVPADNPELAAIALHLLPLKLAPADYPLREHARIAAETIRRGQAGKKG